MTDLFNLRGTLLRLGLLVLGFIPALSFTQNAIFQGKILDRRTGEPLELAKIRVDDEGGVLADSAGKFRIQVAPGKHTLHITYTGYETMEREYEVEAGEIKKLKVKLVQTGSRLRTVVISASQYEKNIEEEIVTMEVVDEELMKNVNATELGEAIDKSVGVQVQEGQVSMRGGSTWSYGIGSRTAVLVDNLNFASGDLGEAQLKHAPLENTQQIEVIKGASSVVYGSSALNGVVNVITKWPEAEPKTEITVFSGAYGEPKNKQFIWWEPNTIPNFSGMFFHHGRRINNVDLIVGGNLNKVNSYLWDGNEFRVRGNFKTRYRHPTKTGLSFGLNGNWMFENSGRFFLAEDLDTAGYRPADSGSDRYIRTNIDPHFKFVTDKGSSHRVLMRWMNVFRYGSGDSIINSSSNLISADYQFQQRFGSDTNGVVVTAGLPVSFGVSVSNLYPGRRYTSSGAAYVQGEYRRKRLTATAGVRYEYNSVDSVVVATIPVVRTGMNFRAGKATFLRGSFGQAYRLPSVGERYLTENLYILNIYPNPDLRPERGWGAEIGIKQGIQLKKWKGYADFNLFLNEYTDFIEYRLGLYPPAGEPPSLAYLGLKPTNVEDARVAGFEFSVYGKGNIGPVELRTLSGYTYNYPGNLDSDTTQRAYGVFFENALNGLFNRIDEPVDVSSALAGVPDTNALLNFRTRHLVKADVEATYQNFSLGYTVYYGSFPERIEALYYFAIPSLASYVERHQRGDLVHGARAAWTWVDPKTMEDKMKVSFIVKNLTNRIYAVRPAKLEAPVNFTLQLRFML